MPTLDLGLIPTPVEPGVYETDEVIVSELLLASTYDLVCDVPLPDAITPTNALSAELLRFDPDIGEWVTCCGFGMPAFATAAEYAAAGEPVKTRFSARSVQSREGTEIGTGQPRKVVFDLVHGKRIKARLTMPTFMAVTVTVVANQHPQAAKAELAPVLDDQGRPVFGADGKPQRKPAGGPPLELHHSIAVADTTTSEADALATTTASHSITAGNAAVMSGAANANAATDHTMTASGSHTFTQRGITAYSSTNAAVGVTSMDSLHNSAGTTGTTTMTRNGSVTNTGISIVIYELSGASATYTGRVVSGCKQAVTTTAQAIAEVAIYGVAGSMLFAAGSDFDKLGAWTVGTGFTSAFVNTVGNYSGGHWRTTDPLAADGWTSMRDASAIRNREYHVIAMEIRAADQVPASTSGVIQLVGTQEGSFAGTTSNQTITFALNGGLARVPAANDLVLVFYSVGSTADRTLTITNTGATAYTYLADLYQNDLFDANLRVGWRLMPSTPETQVILSQTFSTADAGAYIFVVLRGVDQVNPIDVTTTTAGNINTRLANPPSITPVTKGAWVISCGAAAGSTGGVYTAPAATDLLYFRTRTQVDTNDANIGVGIIPWSGSGAVDPAAFTGGGTDTTNDSWAAVSVAIRPAHQSPPPTMLSLRPHHVYRRRNAA